MASTPSERLREALKERHISARELARRMVSHDGGDPRRVENVRRQIQGWLAGDNAPATKNARCLAEVLDYPEDHFATERPPAAYRSLAEAAESFQRIADQLEALVAQLTTVLSEQPPPPKRKPRPR